MMIPQIVPLFLPPIASAATQPCAEIPVVIGGVAPKFVARVRSQQFGEAVVVGAAAHFFSELMNN